MYIQQIETKAKQIHNFRLIATLKKEKKDRKMSNEIEKKYGFFSDFFFFVQLENTSTLFSVKKMCLC